MGVHMAESIAYFAVKSISLSRVKGSKPCTLLDAARHNLREIQAELGAHSHIDPTRSEKNIVLSGPAKAKEVQAQADLLLADAGIGKLRRDHCQAIEVVFSLPTQHGIGDPDAYFQSCLQWAQNALRLPTLSAVIHHDEAAPHSHVLLLPVREGKHVGSSPIGTAELKKLRNSFFEKVAAPAGMRRPNAKVRGTVKQWVIEAVLHRCQTMALPTACGPLWPFFQHCIEREPTEAMQRLGIGIETVRPKEESTAPLTRNPIGIELAPAQLTETVAANPIGIELEAPKNGTLSCVGFATPEAPKQSPRMQQARAAEQSAIARHTIKRQPPALPPAMQPHEDGITRVRGGDYSHDLSAWDAF